MSNLYKQVLAELDKLPQGNTKEGRAWVQKYLGSNKPTKCIKSSVMKKLAKQIVKESNLDKGELINLLDLLYKNAKTYEEVDLAARLLGVTPKLREQIDPNKLDFWLNFTHGWAENDVLTQNSFTAEEILGDWKVWKKLLVKLNKDKNIHKRRASVVLLVKAVRDSDDKRLSDLAFNNTDKLKGEKDILITKAVSWILRSLIKNHKGEVTKYLKENRNTIPKIAVREVETKLLTGRKTRKIKV